MYSLSEPTVEDGGILIYWPDEKLLDLMSAKECGYGIHATNDFGKSKIWDYDHIADDESLVDYLYGYMDWDSVMEHRGDLHLHCVVLLPVKKPYTEGEFKEIKVVGYFENDR